MQSILFRKVFVILSFKTKNIHNKQFDIYHFENFRNEMCNFRFVTRHLIILYLQIF